MKGKNVLNALETLRDKLRGVIERNLVRISPRYNVKVVETPAYLVPFIPSAAMDAYDTLTENPFCIFFVTTDENFAPPGSLAELFQTLVHEEYGHCVNFINSAVEFVNPLSILEKVNTTFHYPISEGISFHRELESLRLLQTLTAKKRLSHNERKLLTVIEGFRESRKFLKELEFVVYEWRIIRFLRAIGDVRINTGKQGIAEFVDWAHNETGLSKNMVFNQIFIFQSSPGYAPCYSIGGMVLRRFQDLAKKHGMDTIKFNTFVCSLGAPPRTFFEQKLGKFIKEH
jgi:hypothetical protein